MEPKRRVFIRATLAMIGTIIGAGIFGIPAMFSRVGLFTGSVVFWVVAALVMAMHLLYVELIARDPVRRRFPGHVGVALGSWGKAIGVVTHTGQLVGANLAYIILGGEFFSVLTRWIVLGDYVLFWQVVFWIGGALTVLFGLRFLAKLESGLTWALIVTMVVIILLAFPYFDAGKLSGQNWALAFEPLGVFLFALTGLSVISEAHEITGRSVATTRRTVVLGSFVAAILTWLFGMALFFTVERDGSLPGGPLLPLVGFLAVATSFITTAFDLQAMFRLDLKQPQWVARGISLGLPLFLLFVTERDFLATISIVGLFFTAINGILVSAAASVVMSHDRKRPPIWWRDLVPMAVAGLFAFALIQRIFAIGVS